MKKSPVCFVCFASLLASVQAAIVPALDSAAFLGSETQDVSSTFEIRNNFYLNNANALAYLRFEVDSDANTIGGIAFADVASVTLNLNVVSFNGSNTSSQITVWALNDLISSSEPDGLSETTWTEANFLRATAPHGPDLIDTSDGVVLADAASVTATLNSITLDVGLFKTFLSASSNDEISIPLVGESSIIPTISSANNANTALRPTLTITAIPEPSSLALMGIALAGLLVLRRRMV